MSKRSAPLAVALILAMAVILWLSMSEGGGAPMESKGPAPMAGSGSRAGPEELVDLQSSSTPPVAERLPQPIDEALPARVRGQVIWPDGVAAYRATVAQDMRDLPLGTHPAFAEATTDQEGAFELTVPRSLHRLVAISGDALSVPFELDARRGDRDGIALVMARLPRLRGRLTDAQGRPVQGEIRVITTMPNSLDVDVQSTKARREFVGCDATGDFRRDIPALYRLSIRGWAKGHAPTRSIDVEAEAIANDLRLVARQLVDLELTVLASDGVPRVGLEVGFGDPEYENHSPASITWAGKSDARGIVILRGVAAEERCTVAVKSPSAEGFVQAFQIDSRLPSQQLTLSDEDLQPATVEVVVRGAAHPPPRGIQVVMIPVGGFASRCEGSSSSDRVQFDRVWPGIEYQVYVSERRGESVRSGPSRTNLRSVLPAARPMPGAPILVAARLTVRPGNQEFEVERMPPGTCLLRALHADGTPMVGAGVEIEGPSFRGEVEDVGSTGGDGSLTIRDLVPGEHVIRVRSGRRAVAMSSFVVDPGAVRQVELREER